MGRRPAPQRPALSSTARYPPTCVTCPAHREPAGGQAQSETPSHLTAEARAARLEPRSAPLRPVPMLELTAAAGRRAGEQLHAAPSECNLRGMPPGVYVPTSSIPQRGVCRGVMSGPAECASCARCPVLPGDRGQTVTMVTLFRAAARMESRPAGTCQSSHSRAGRGAANQHADGHVHLRSALVSAAFVSVVASLRICGTRRRSAVGVCGVCTSADHAGCLGAGVQLRARAGRVR